MTHAGITLGVQTVDVERLIVSDRGNDRTVFSEHELRELADSIDRIGQITPVIVRPGPGDRLEIVAGERRTRAVRLLGSPTIVVDVRPLSDHDAAELMLAENLVRVDLDPVDEGRSLARRMAETGVSIGILAKQWDRSEGYVKDRLALLELTEDIAHLVRTGQLPIGKGASMAGLVPERQRAAVRRGADLSAPAFRRLCSELRAEQDQASMFDLAELTTEEYDAEAKRYVDKVAADPIPDIPKKAFDAFTQALVGPAEIADRLGVGKSTVAQWRRRYDDFPAPLAVLGNGRQAPRGGQPAGTPVFFWMDVLNWAVATGRT